MKHETRMDITPIAREVKNCRTQDLWTGIPIKRLKREMVTAN